VVGSNSTTQTVVEVASDSTTGMVVEVASDCSMGPVVLAASSPGSPASPTSVLYVTPLSVKPLFIFW
jgi:hypothetical protein